MSIGGTAESVHRNGVPVLEWRGQPSQTSYTRCHDSVVHSRNSPDELTAGRHAQCTRQDVVERTSSNIWVDRSTKVDRQRCCLI